MIFFMIIMVRRTYNVNKSLSNGWKLKDLWLVWSDMNKNVSVLFSHFTLKCHPHLFLFLFSPQSNWRGSSGEVDHCRLSPPQWPGGADINSNSNLKNNTNVDLTKYSDPNPVWVSCVKVTKFTSSIYPEGGADDLPIKMLIPGSTLPNSSVPCIHRTTL